MILVSSCLLGDCCKYSGGHNKNDKLLASYQEEELVKVCPEVLGGLQIPRAPAEIQGGSAKDVLEGKARICTKEGKDVTQAFIKGAYKVLEIAQKYHIKQAILKAKSPSCGFGKVYNGTFSGELIEGNGITAELLKSHGIDVKTEEALS